MAIANALGSNIQNIFVALALPWTLTTILSNPHPFKVSAKGQCSSTTMHRITIPDRHPRQCPGYGRDFISTSSTGCERQVYSRS